MLYQWDMQESFSYAEVYGQSLEATLQVCSMLH
jgi:hypothetical protein